MFGWPFSSRWARKLSEPVPPDWIAWLRANVAHFDLLDEREREGLVQGVRVMVAEKFWEGCLGLRVTDEMKVTIAGQASLMLLGIEHDFFRPVQTILIYPTHFQIPGDHGVFSGQSHHRGPIILAWDQVLSEGKDPSRGSNLVIHEFAHQLDEMDGEINGTPYLRDPEMAARWHEDMNREFASLQRKLSRGRTDFLGDYAATDDAEFFAVASERFFTLPQRLQRTHPNLYQLLADYYQVNPLKWFDRRD